MNRPAPVKTDNFFLLLFRALRQRRVPLSLRIAFHSLLLVSVTLVIYALVMGLQFKQAMQQQADALGDSLLQQTRESATQLLVSNDLLSLNVLLNSLVKNKLVAHAAVYSVGSDSRVLAEAGNRPNRPMLGESSGAYSTDITFQDVIAGHLRVSLDMRQFQQPLTISLQSMGILGVILLALALILSMRLGRYISTPLLQLRVWLRDPEHPTPGAARLDEIGDLARQLQARLAPEPPEHETDDESVVHQQHEDIDTYQAPVTRAPNLVRADLQEPRFGDEALDDFETEHPARDFDDEDPFTDLRPLQPAAASTPAPVVAGPSAVLAIQLGAQEQLRRLPRSRLMNLLQRYRDCLNQAATLYQAELHTLNDGSSLMLFHSQDSGAEYLTQAICCGELMRALGHALQIEVADSGITLQLQLALTQGENLVELSQGDLLLSDTAKNALALSLHSRNLLLVERSISEDSLLGQRMRIRSIASPEGASCVERLLEPYPSLLERQLAQMHDRAPLT